MQAICFLTFCYCLLRIKGQQLYTSKRDETMQNRYTYRCGNGAGKRELHLTKPRGCMWQITTSRIVLPDPPLRKQYHMCELIYEVLTLGPERISILLGKCFPLGSVSATAYRCFSRAAERRGFSHHGMNEKAC